MTQPVPNEVVTAADVPRGLLYVADPTTGDIKAVPREDAKTLVLARGWFPVDENTGERLRTEEWLRDESTALEGLGYGAAQGLTGGLINLAVEPGSPEALALRGIAEGSPAATVAGEVAGTVAPFVGPLKAARLGTFPGLADEAGQILTRGIAGETPGFLRQVGARAAGLGLEGGAYGVASEVARAHIDDSPLTAEKLGFGFMAGALPGAIIGVPLGAAEGAIKGLGRRYATRGALTRDEVIAPGATEADARLIAERDFGASAPGMLESFQAANAKNPLVTSDLLALSKDSGPVGRQARRELFQEGPMLRAEAEEATAKAFDDLADMEAVGIGEWSGRLKKEHAQRLIPESMVSDADVDEALMRASNSGAYNLPTQVNRAPEIERVTRSVIDTLGDNPEAAGALKAALGIASDDTLERMVRKGLIANDNDVVGHVGTYLKKVPAGLRKGGPANDVVLPANDVIPSPMGKLPAAGVANDVVANDVGLGLQQLDGVGAAANDVRPRRWAWQKESLNKLDQFGEELEALENQPRGYTGTKNKEIRDMRGLLNGVRDRVIDGKRWQAATELDYLKKRLGKVASKKEYLGAGDDFLAMSRRWYEDVRQNLEDPRLWGSEFSGLQRQMNALLHKRLSRADRFWDTYFSDSGTPDPRNPWANLKRADRAKLNAAVSKFNAPEHDVDFRMVVEHVKEARELNKLMGEYFKTDRIEAANLKKWQGAADEAEKQLTRAKHFAMRIEQGKALLGDVGVGSGWPLRMAATYAFGGPAGLVAGELASNLLNPGKALYARSVLERALRTSEGRIARGVAAILSGKKFQLPAGPGTAIAAKAVTSLLSEKNPERRAKAYNQTLEDLADATLPGRAEAAMDGLKPAGLFVPKAATAAAESYRRAAQVVLQMAPVRPTVGPFGDAELPYISDTELQTWEDVYRGALDPIGVLEAVEDGELSMEMVDAADQAAPALMTHIRSLIVETVSEHGEAVSYETKVQLSTLFKMPLDPTMTSEYVTAMQLLHRSRFQDGMGPRSRRTFDETGVNDGYEQSTMSNADRLEKEDVIR